MTIGNPIKKHKRIKKEQTAEEFLRQLINFCKRYKYDLISLELLKELHKKLKKYKRIEMLILKKEVKKIELKVEINASIGRTMGGD